MRIVEAAIDHYARTLPPDPPPAPDLARLLADTGLPGRANEAYMAMHGAEDVA